MNCIHPCLVSEDLETSQTVSIVTICFQNYGPGINYFQMASDQALI